MTTVRVKDLPSLGNLAQGDKVVAERVAGTTSLGTFPYNVMTGTAGTVTITNGDGASGNPTFTISSSYVGQTTITTLGTVSTGTWGATNIALNKGGTNASLTGDLGGLPYMTATAMAVLASTATASKLLLSGASAAPTWSTSTIPSSAGATANKVLLSDGTNYVLSTPTFPNASATTGKRIKSDGTNWIASTTTMPDSGTSGKVLIGDGTNYVESTSTIPTSAGATAGKTLVSDGTNYVLSTPTFPNASATTRKIIVSDGTNWTASTETYAVPSTSGKVMQSDGTNWTSATPTGTGTPVLATGPTLSAPILGTPASGTLTSCTGLPVASGISGLGTGVATLLATNTTGSTNLVGATSPTLVTPTLGAATATSVTFSPTTGGIVGTTTNDNTGAGKVGEYIESIVTQASPVALVSATSKTVTSISLTAGDWDVFSNILFTGGATTTVNTIAGGISQTTNTLDLTAGRSAAINTVGQVLFNSFAPTSYANVCPGTVRLSLSGTTTVYLIAAANFGVSTANAFGIIAGRRVR